MIVRKTFKNEEEGFEFYNKYAYDKGFAVRKDYVEHDSTTNAVTHRRYLCFRQGHRKEKHMDRSDIQRYPRALTRCGCKAEFAISLNKKTGDWFVKKFVDMHNHPLAKPGEAGFLWSHRGLSDVQKAEALELKAGGLRTHQVMEVMEKHNGGFEDLGFTSKDLYNFFDRHKKVQICEGDADHVIRYMQSRQGLGVNLKALELAKKVQWEFYISSSLVYEEITADKMKNMSSESIATINMKNIQGFAETLLGNLNKHVEWFADSGNRSRLSRTSFLLIILQALLIPTEASLDESLCMQLVLGFPSLIVLLSHENKDIRSSAIKYIEGLSLVDGFLNKEQPTGRNGSHPEIN